MTTREKVIYHDPSCYGCEYYKPFGPQITVRRRVLFHDAQYCTYDKIMRMPKSMSSLYTKCPLFHPYPHIHIYTRGPAQDDVYWMDCPGDVHSIHEIARYIYQGRTSAPVKAKKFVDEICNKQTAIYSLLLDYFPEHYDMIDVDSGLSHFFLMYMPDNTWMRVFPAEDKLHQGYYGAFRIEPSDCINPLWYRIEPVSSDCLGYLRGHFGPGTLRTDWVDVPGKELTPAALVELESLLLTLQNEGFLKSYSTLQRFCLYQRRADIPDKYGEYGFYCLGHHGQYYFRIIMGEEKSNNVYVLCYGPPPVLKKGGLR